MEFRGRFSMELHDGGISHARASTVYSNAN